MHTMWKLSLSTFSLHYFIFIKPGTCSVNVHFMDNKLTNLHRGNILHGNVVSLSYGQIPEFCWNIRCQTREFCSSSHNADLLNDYSWEYNLSLWRYCSGPTLGFCSHFKTGTGATDSTQQPVLLLSQQQSYRFEKRNFLCD